MEDKAIHNKLLKELRLLVERKLNEHNAKEKERS